MTETLYHKMLRISLPVVAVVLLFDSGLVFPITQQLSRNTQTYLANSIGIYAQVEPNELNTITAELTRRQQELDDREARLREIEARDFGTTDTSNFSTYILSAILFMLTVLIVVNYALDWHRTRVRIA